MIMATRPAGCVMMTTLYLVIAIVITIAVVIMNIMPATLSYPTILYF
jgi:hypothetical protein